MIPFLAFVGGPARKLALYGGLAVALLVAGWFALRQHDARVLAEQQAAVRVQQMVRMQVDHERVVAALEADEATLQARVKALSNARKEINAAPRTTGCAGSPAIRAALDGLRGATPGGPGASP